MAVLVILINVLIHVCSGSLLILMKILTDRCKVLPGHVRLISSGQYKKRTAKTANLI